MLPRDTSLGSLGDKAGSIGLWRNHNVSRGLEHRLQPFFLLYACIVTIDSACIVTIDSACIVTVDSDSGKVQVNRCAASVENTFVAQIPYCVINSTVQNHRQEPRFFQISPER